MGQLQYGASDALASFPGSKTNLFLPSTEALQMLVLASGTTGFKVQWLSWSRKMENVRDKKGRNNDVQGKILEQKLCNRST